MRALRVEHRQHGHDPIDDGCIYDLAFAGSCPFDQRREDPDHAVERPAAVIADQVERGRGRLSRLAERGLRYGLQTMCEGGGTANVTIVEAL